jgi:hypothetical protein
MSNRKADQLGNEIAREGCDRCFCGCKYWEYDRCIDCNTHIDQVLRDEGIEEDDRGVRYVLAHQPIPSSFSDPVTCGTCGRTWDDAVPTGVTPAPSARCPFEYEHGEEDEDDGD